jgi:hypothetical protein
MRKAAMLLLVALLVGALPAAAVPISMFPEPFVKSGTIYTTDGKSTMAIIIGDKAASVDMIGAAMLAMKIGSHLYYTNALYVNVDDAAKHGITLYYGGFDANEYNVSTTTWTLVPTNTTYHYLFWNATTTLSSGGNETAPGEFAFLGGADCNSEGYDYVIAPLDRMKVYPARFHFILGENATISDVKKLKPPSSLYASPLSWAVPYGFYVQTGLKEFSNTTGDVNIPWLGFKLHVDNIHFGTPNQMRVRMLTPDGITVAFLNISADSSEFYFDGVTTTPNPQSKVVVVGDVKIKVGKHSGVPFFIIPSGMENWIVLKDFGVILANISSAPFIVNATTDEIKTYYGAFANAINAKAIFNTTTYPVKAWGIFNVTGEKMFNYTYIWSKDVFPWFNGAVNAYIFPKKGATTMSDTIEVFDNRTGIATWNFNKTWSEIIPWWNKTKCGDFIFTSIGNRTMPGAVICPLTQKRAYAYENCTYICGNWTGVYKVKTTEETIHKLICPPIYDDIAFSVTKSTVYARGATGVFAGIFDRFENVSGFKGTTQIKVETSGNVTYPKDITSAADVDQIFEKEAVFSFVKMPIIYLDSWVFVNNTLSKDLVDKDLILIGGPAVNTVVKYLNDVKVLDVTFKLVNTTWALEYAGKTYDLDTVLKILVDSGYLTAPISKDYIYRVEGGNGLGVIEYAKKNPFGSGNILVVAGTDRYGTLAASVALADPTKLVASTAPVFYAAGRTTPNAVIVLGIKPTVVPPAVPPAALTPVIVAIPAGAAG